MTTPRRQDPYAKTPSTTTWLLRLTLFGIVLVALFSAGYLAYSRWQTAVDNSGITLADANPSLNPAQRFFLARTLVDRTEQLRRPAGTALEPISFTIPAGSSAETVATDLQAANLLADTELFLNYLLYYGLDSKLVAGTFTVDPQWTIPELAGALTQGLGREITLNFLPGMRLEEMANYLDVTSPGSIDAQEFLALAQRQLPLDVSQYAFLSSISAETSLEGYLFPGSYAISVDATAADLIHQMLTRFDEQVTPAMRQSFGAQGLSLRDAVTLAAIVGREGVLVEERPTIASVFLNRLRDGMPLQADPTVQYAVGYDEASGTWWKSPLDPADVSIDHPYNTYQIPGLPPGPIASPSLSSLEAVANPEQTNYYFFVVDCVADSVGDTLGRHRFAVTYDEHVANVNLCR